MIGVATTIFDVSGARIFNGGNQEKVADNRKGSRRVVRTATLDGGVAVSDLGYSDGDRDVEIQEAEATAAAVDFAKYIVENYGRVVVSTPDGAYEAAPDSYSLASGVLTLKVLIISKLSE
jgi:hypothetical protein